MNNKSQIYYNILRIVVIGVGVMLLARLLWMQFHSDEYLARARALLHSPTLTSIHDHRKNLSLD